MIKISTERDALITEDAMRTLNSRYFLEGEGVQDLFVRVSKAYANDDAHAQRLYDYMSKLWFLPATPILSNGGTPRGLPISCFLNSVQDSLTSIADKWHENVWLSSRGGGIGTCWSNVRSINESIGQNGTSSGIMPFLKVQDSLSLAISQGSLRRGSTAVYLNVEHAEIIEFLEMRKPSGGDMNRKSLNIHHGVVVSDAFMHAVERDSIWYLKSPKTKEVIDSIRARDLWVRILTARIETGEPYILFIDSVNKNIHPAHKTLGLNVETSNLCSEITLTTGLDHKGKDRTAVCCLSSCNLETYDEWKDNKEFFRDIIYFLDNVLDGFMRDAPEHMKSAVYSAYRERSIGLGVMGLHYYFQARNIAFDSLIAKVHNRNLFQNIHKMTMEAAAYVTADRGSCPDAIDAGMVDRFINKLAIAPTASIGRIAGTSPSVEPLVSNAYTSKTLSGSSAMKNKYLEKLIKNKGLNEDQVWSQIISANGSIQHLDAFSDEEKEIFKTAYEIDQASIIDMAADRAQYICQAQSINLFFYGNVNKSYLHHIHYLAWKKGVKSLYYSRSLSIQRAENIDKKSEAMNMNTLHHAAEENKYEECLSCQ